MNPFLGIDVGTTSLKMVLFDESGNALKTVSKAYTLDTRGDRVEFDPEQYWEMFSDGYRQIKEEYEVTALAIDTQCETLIVTGKTIVTLRNAESACLGAAIVAGAGAGFYESVISASKKLVQTDRIYTPSGKDYAEAFARYRKYETEMV